jgi:hypothetical protein
MADGYEVEVTLEYVAERSAEATTTAINGPKLWRRARCGAVRKAVARPGPSLLRAHAGDLRRGKPALAALSSLPCADARLTFQARGIEHTVAHGRTHRFRGTDAGATVELLWQGKVVDRWELGIESARDACSPDQAIQVPTVLDVELICTAQHAVASALVWKRPPPSVCQARTNAGLAREPGPLPCVLAPPRNGAWKLVTARRARLDLATGKSEPIDLRAPALHP